MDSIKIFILPADLEKQRLDIALQRLLPEYSRTCLQTWVKNGQVKHNGEIITSNKVHVFAGDLLEVEIIPLPEKALLHFAQEISLQTMYEDDDLLVINKPIDLVVHPGAGNMEGTLLNALLHHEPALNNIPRAGIVHRLDKDTSGLLVVAKNIKTQTNLIRQLQERTVKRVYLAIVWGTPLSSITVNQPIGRHPFHRTKMAISASGKSAITHFEVVEQFAFHSLVRCRLETGRTHQIRVHAQYLKTPIVGDDLYGFKQIAPAKLSSNVRNTTYNFPRQALHAEKLALLHPSTHELIEWECPLPDDMQGLLEVLQNAEKMNEG